VNVLGERGTGAHVRHTGNIAYLYQRIGRQLGNLLTNQNALLKNLDVASGGIHLVSALLVDVTSD
jgi:hypothetical protein